MERGQLTVLTVERVLFLLWIESRELRSREIDIGINVGDGLHSRCLTECEAGAPNHPTSRVACFSLKLRENIHCY